MAFARHPAAAAENLPPPPPWMHDRNNKGRPIHHPLISPSSLQKPPEVRLPAVPSQVRCPSHTWAWCPRIERPLEAVHRRRRRRCLNQPSLNLLRRLTRRAAAALHYLLCVLSATSFHSVREKRPRARLFPVRRRIPLLISPRLVDVPA